jgi:hypothetical protein
MSKLPIGAILLGGLLLAPFQAALAQTTTEVAYAYESRPSDMVFSGYMVFFDKGTRRLSGVADETIRRAATDAKRSAGLIRVVGRDDYAVVVKDTLVRDGVPARSIIVVPTRGDNPLPAIVDGVSNPADRRVEIHY